jgi:hypothetical protein
VKSRIIRSGSDRDKLSYNNREQRAQKEDAKMFIQFAENVERLTDNVVDAIPEKTQISFDFDDNPLSVFRF